MEFSKIEKVSLARKLYTCGMPCFDAMYEKEIEALENWLTDHGYNKRSFSEAIIENNSVSRRCNLGHTHRVYRLNFRSHVFIPALGVLLGEGSMTTSKLADYFDGMLGRSIGKYAHEMRHWELIERADDKKIGGRYRITQLGIDFLNGEEAVPEWLYPEEADLPKEDMSGPLRYVGEFQYLDQSSREVHVRHSVAIKQAALDKVLAL